MADNESEKAYNSWPEDFPEVTSLVSYVALRRNPDPEIKELYDRAKNREDREAAAELIQRLVTDDGVEKIKALAARNPHAIVVSVHAVEGSGKNKIPQVLAEFIGMHGNLEVDNNIVQTSIVGNTGQNTWHRLAHRAAFEGSVKPGRDYVLVDDIFSAGGTLSELRHFIETNGGNVVDTVTMANGAKSLNAQLSVTKEHILELERKFGIESLQRFLKEEHLYGGNYQALTDAEARTLLGAKTLDEARDRIAEARQERDRGIRPEMVPGTSPDAESLNTDPQTESAYPITIPLAELFDYVKEHGSYEYLQLPDEGAFDLDDESSFESHTLHTAEALMADTRYAGEITSRQIDLSSSPFWSTVWSTTQDGSNGFLQDVVPVRNKNDLLLMYEEHAEDLFVPELEQNAASYEAENDISKEQNTMSDENKEAGEGFEEQPAPEQEAAFGPDETAEQEQNIQKEKKGMTIDELFDRVKETGGRKYLIEADPYENSNGDLYMNEHVLCTAEGIPDIKKYSDIMEDTDVKTSIETTDLSSSPFWVVTSYEPPIPVKDANEFIKLYGDDFDIAAHVLNNNLQHTVTAWNGSLDGEAAQERIEALRRRAGIEIKLASNETEGLEQEPRERPSPDEIAFRTALKMRTQIAESLQNGSLPCLPGADGIADTKPAVNLVTGTHYHNANLLYLKDFQKRNGFPTAEYATQDAIQKSGIPIRAGESGITISFAEKNKQSGDWENKNVRLFNVAQTAKPWAFKAYAEKVSQEREQEKQAFLKSQYGDKYQPQEKTEQKPRPDITCSSTEPERYLGQYLAAVSMGSAFKATHQQATEFSQKLHNRLYEPVENGYPDPFKLSKICKEAGVQCKEIIKGIEQPQHKQDQTQQHSRHM